MNAEVERAGEPVMGREADKIKERVESFQEMQELLSSVDMTDPENWAVVLTPENCMFAAQTENLPHVVYATTKMLLEIMRWVDSVENPQLSLEARYASMAALKESGQINFEESDNETCKDRTTN